MYDLRFGYNYCLHLYGTEDKQCATESLALGLFHSSGKQNANTDKSLLHIERVNSSVVVFVGRCQDLRMR